MLSAYHGISCWKMRCTDEFFVVCCYNWFFYSVLHFDKAGDMQKPETANLMYKVSQIDHFHLQLFSAVQSHCIIYRKGNRYQVTYFIFNYILYFHIEIEDFLHNFNCSRNYKSGYVLSYTLTQISDKLLDV